MSILILNIGKISSKIMKLDNDKIYRLSSITSIDSLRSCDSSNSICNNSQTNSSRSSIENIDLHYDTKYKSLTNYIKNIMSMQLFSKNHSKKI